MFNIALSSKGAHSHYILSSIFEYNRFCFVGSGRAPLIRTHCSPYHNIHHIRKISQINKGSGFPDVIRLELLEARYWARISLLASTAHKNGAQWTQYYNHTVFSYQYHMNQSSFSDMDKIWIWGIQLFYLIFLNF